VLRCAFMRTAFYIPKKFTFPRKEVMEAQTEAKPVVFITQPQVAEMLHHTITATLRWWRHQNRGLRSIRVGKRVLYRLSDVEEWLSAQQAETARGGVR
jgi:hypothetical protein